MFAELYSEITSLPADIKIRQNICRVAKDDTTLLRSIANSRKRKRSGKRGNDCYMKTAEQLNSEPTWIEHSLSVEDARQDLEEDLAKGRKSAGDNRDRVSKPTRVTIYMEHQSSNLIDFIALIRSCAPSYLGQSYFHKNIRNRLSMSLIKMTNNLLISHQNTACTSYSNTHFGFWVFADWACATRPYFSSWM